MDAAIDDLEPEGIVSLLGNGVVDEGVGGHFAAAVGAGPVLGSGEQGAADALAAEGGRDVPAFEVADGMGGVAAVGVGAEANFSESDEPAVGRFGDQVREGQCGEAVAAEFRGEFRRMFGEGAFRPEVVEERSEAVEVVGCGGADHADRAKGTGYRARGCLLQMEPPGTRISLCVMSTNRNLSATLPQIPLDRCGPFHRGATDWRM